MSFPVRRHLPTAITKLNKSCLSAADKQLHLNADIIDYGGDDDDSNDDNDDDDKMIVIIIHHQCMKTAAFTLLTYLNSG